MTLALSSRAITAARASKCPVAAMSVYVSRDIQGITVIQVSLALGDIS